jgi:hypothetical protein
MVGEVDTRETDSALSRTHRRAVAVSKRTNLDGRVIYYWDSYSLKGPDTTYLYAKHSKDPEGFFRALDGFFALLREDLRELRGTSFPFISNVDGKLVTQRLTLPFAENFGRRPGRFPWLGKPGDRFKDVRFVRASMPFGDLSIEFGTDVTTKYESAAKLGIELMETSFDAPLAGVELTRSTILVPLLANIHWAAELLPKEVLISLGQEMNAAAPVPAY